MVLASQMLFDMLDFSMTGLLPVILQTMASLSGSLLILLPASSVLPKTIEREQ